MAAGRIPRTFMTNQMLIASASPLFFFPPHLDDSISAWELGKSNQQEKCVKGGQIT